jgi:hypothetical protein
MKTETYEFIKKHIHRLDINYEGGTVLNRATSVTPNGYAKVKLYYKSVSVHQIIAVMKYDVKCVGLVVNHIDGNKLNNKPENLEVVTQAENAQHSYDVLNRKSVKGARHGRAKLTAEQVAHIIASTDTMTNLAKQFNVSIATISLIKKGKRWAKGSE